MRQPLEGAGKGTSLNLKVQVPGYKKISSRFLFREYQVCPVTQYHMGGICMRKTDLWRIRRLHLFANVSYKDDSMCLTGRDHKTVRKQINET